MKNAIVKLMFSVGRRLLCVVIFALISISLPVNSIDKEVFFNNVSATKRAKISYNLSLQPNPCSDNEDSYLSVHYNDGTMGMVLDETHNSNRIVNNRNYGDFQKTVVKDSGKDDSESIVAVFLGDGFASNEQTLFVNKVQEIANYMVTIEPFNYYKDYLTVYAIHTISNDSGISGERNGEFACLDSNGNPATVNCTPYDGIFNCTHGNDTYFHGYYRYRPSANRVILEMDSSDRAVARSIALYNYSSVNMIQVIANSSMRGGTGETSLPLGVAYTSINYGNPYSDWKRITLHEFGHSFGGLWDEYWNGTVPQHEYPNASQNNDQNTVPWKSWLGYDGVGIYPFASEEDDGNPNQSSNPWFRPHQSCIMRYTNSPFCPVCQNELLSKMATATGVSVFDTTNIGDNNIEIDSFNLDYIGEFTIPLRINGRVVTSLDAQSFKDHTCLTSVIIPQTIDNIGSEAFKNCSDLSAIDINRGQAPFIVLGTNAFQGCSSNLQITVPTNRIGDYKNRSIWSNYADKIVPEINYFTTYNLYQVSNINASCTLSAGFNKLYKLIVNEEARYIFTPSASNLAKVTLYDSTFAYIESSIFSVSRVLDYGATYYLSVEFNDTTSSGTITTTMQKDNTHYHSYGSPYIWIDYTRHRTSCSCGSTKIQGHAVSPDAFANGEHYAYCLFCGGLATAGFVPCSTDTYPTSINGSYILPNGVIVLVDDDYDAYINGTLVFVDPNSN